MNSRNGLKALLAQYRASLDIAIDKFSHSDPLFIEEGRDRLNQLLERVRKLIAATPDASATLEEVTDLLHFEAEIANRIQAVSVARAA